MNYKMHPQPSALGKSTKAAKKYGFKNKSVLDCFCGCGTHIIAAIRAQSTHVTGTDIEDYSDLLRPETRRLFENSQLINGALYVAWGWGYSAEHAITQFPFSLLFVDPPNPCQVVGGSLLSAVRDTKMTGQERGAYWEERFSKNNWINKRDETITKVKDLFKTVLKKDKEIVANCFTIKSNKFSYKTELEEEFKLTQIYDSYYEVAE